MDLKNLLRVVFCAVVGDARRAEEFADGEFYLPIT